MKKILFLSLIAVFVLSMSGVALANFGVHATPDQTTAPFFAADTDACAGCHRAHTAVGSKLAWAVGIDQPIAESTIPAGSASSFCLICHGDSGTLADTDVINGMWSIRKGSGGESVPNGVLNAGGFNKMGGTSDCSSIHKVEGTTTTAWGYDSTSDRGAAAQLTIACGNCHDPHGSYNYRLLKTAAGEKIESNETGWHPTPPATYSPDYTYEAHATTNYRYAKAPTVDEGLSSHCWMCHKKYKAPAGAGRTSQGKYETITYDPSQEDYDWMNATRFRHAVNVPLSNYSDGVGGGLYPLNPTLSTTLPLEEGTEDWMGCLTCHRAHGTDKTMIDDAAGIPPAGNSAFLRRDNRGVCQDCHDK